MLWRQHYVEEFEPRKGRMKENKLNMNWAYLYKIISWLLLNPIINERKT